MRHLVIALALASTTAVPSAFAQAGDDVIAKFAARTTPAPAVNGVAVAGPVVLAPRPPEHIPPSLHEQIRHLKARLDNAYPDASDARKLHFIAEHLDISFRRLWNAYNPGRPEPPMVRPTDVRPVDARPIDARRVDRVEPDRARLDRVKPDSVKPDRVRPVQIDRIRPAVRPDLRPAPVARPVRPRG